MITNKKLLSSGLQDRVQESKSLRHVGDGSIWHEHLPYDSSVCFPPISDLPFEIYSDVKYRCTRTRFFL